MWEGQINQNHTHELKTQKQRVSTLPNDLSLVWLFDLTTGRLARERMPRVKAEGASPSDMASKDSRDAKERCSPGSPTAD